MKKTTRRSTLESGFTLVEVMLTLLIMAGIMVTITQILTAARQTRDEIHNIQERQLAGPAILERLERDIRALFVYNRDPRFYVRIRDRVTGGYDADSIDFVCTVDSLIPYREHDGEDFRSADFNEVGYRLRYSPESDDFLEIYRREDFGVDEEPFDGGGFSLLHDRVKGFNIEIFDEDGEDAEPLDEWGTEADDENIGLPHRISIELTVELAPRLVREQLVTDRRTMVYKRVIRFPKALFLAQDVKPVPAIPLIEPPIDPSTGGPAGGPGSGDGDTITATGDGGLTGGGGFSGGGDDVLPPGFGDR